jgi:Tfp pilus assembly protein PilF
MSQDSRLSRDALAALFLSVALALLTLLVYCRSFDHAFVNYDDPVYVYQNHHVQAGLTAEGIRWAFTTFDHANWHPLTWLSLQLDATLYGPEKAGGFHVTNVLLHTANTLLLFWVLSNMTGAVWRSAVVAALFALHPLHVESVAWVAERKDVLSTMFWMLTLAAYLAYVCRPSVGRYLLVMLTLGLGLLVKPMLVTLPFVLMLLDYWPLQRVREWTTLRPLVLEKLPLFALVLASCVLTFLAQRQGRAVASFELLPVPVRAANALLAYVSYLAQLFWPLHLAVYYPHPGTTVSVMMASAAGLLLLLITGLVLGPGRRWPYLAVGWLWYVGTLVPVIGLIQVGGQAMADRYTYVPLIGLFVLLTWGVSDLARGWRLPRAVLVGTVALVLSACVGLTWVQLGHWKNTLTLWEHAIAVTENNARAHYNLGTALRDQNRREEALIEYRKAVECDPRSVLAHNNLGTELAHTSRFEEALAEYRKALDLDPNFAQAHNNVGSVLQDLGEPQQALVEFRKAIALDPDYAMAHSNLGTALQRLGRFEGALTEFRRAVKLDPKAFLSHYNLGHMLQDLDRRQEAIKEYEEALHLQSDSPEAHCNLGLALLKEGRFAEALTHLRRGDELGSRNPGWPRLSPQTLWGAERMALLERKLPAISKGEAQPSDVSERLLLALMCRYQRRYTLSARLYAESFAEEPRLADDLQAGHRYAAAAAAACAGCGQGVDAAQLEGPEHSRLRTQALNWLRAELALWAKSQDRAAVQQALRTWKQSADLAGVRDAPALMKLPEAERAAWQQLWREVKALSEPEA